MSAIKTASPKQMGAVRDCYTCRIRRKKCDGWSDGSGRCMTCVRLRLECLGFGANRPDWLRESRSVDDLREKIKSFIAAQGMIKGHSGTASRGAEAEHPILQLSDNYSSASESPPTPTLSLTDPSRPHHITSNIRDDLFGMGGHEYDDYSSAFESPPTPTRSLTDPSRPHHITSNIRDDLFGMGGHEYDDYSSASESSPTPTLSLTDPSRPHHITSNISHDLFGMGGHEYGSSSSRSPSSILFELDTYS
ncbi:hypothetical protein DXG01_007756 [Tephrocybe rancida]|nr:hypothetical protein DXG01_007756 [Tephrocybe rancida]